MSNRPQITIFTDGGCNPNPGLGGYAAILTKAGSDAEKVVTGAVPDTTNYRMELLALVAGLEALTMPSDVTVVSDNNNVVRGFNEWLDGWMANGWRNSRNKLVEHSDLWQRIDAQRQQHTITLVKVKAHVADYKASDIEKMNTRADALVHAARQAYLDEQTAHEADEADASDETRNYRLYIAGSRKTSDNMLEYTRRVVARAIENNWTIVVGDNPQGVDNEVVKEARRLAYTDVIVVGIAAKPRNGGVPDGTYIRFGNSYSERDQAMARSSDRGIFIWNGTSSGTRTAYRYMRSLQHKMQHLMDFATTFAEERARQSA